MFYLCRMQPGMQSGGMNNMSSYNQMGMTSQSQGSYMPQRMVPNQQQRQQRLQQMRLQQLPQQQQSQQQQQAALMAQLQQQMGVRGGQQPNNTYNQYGQPPQY